jgi:hypothetical protein
VDNHSIGKRTIGVLLCVLASFVFGIPATALPSRGTLKQEVINRDAKGHVTRITQVAYWDGSKLRLEKLGKPTRVQLVIGSNVYAYVQTGSKIGNVLRADVPPNAKGQLAFISVLAAQAKQFKTRAKKVGSEKIGSFNCDVYTFSSQHAGKNNIRLDSKAWINRDPQLPITIRNRVTVQGLGSSTIEVKSVNFGAVPASKFQVPKGAKIVDMKKLKMVPPKAEHNAPAAPLPGNPRKPSTGR